MLWPCAFSSTEFTLKGCRKDACGIDSGRRLLLVYLSCKNKKYYIKQQHSECLIFWCLKLVKKKTHQPSLSLRLLPQADWSSKEPQCVKKPLEGAWAVVHCRSQIFTADRFMTGWLASLLGSVLSSSSFMKWLASIRLMCCS